MTQRIGFLIFPGFNLLDLSGPLSVFETANQHLAGENRYLLQVCAATAGMISSSNGLRVQARAVDKPFTTFIVVGGSGVSQASRDSALLALLQSDSARRYVSVCTGAFLLAAAGRLAGKRVTTHWRRAAELQRLVPDARLQPDSIVVQDGDIWTSAGATAGMDIALALIEAQNGASLAHQVARELLIPNRRTQGQLQFMRLRDITPPSPRVQRVLAFIGDNLHGNLNVTTLAEKAHLSTRQFTREFVAHTGLTPARAVERLRVEYARSRLEGSNETPAAIAAQAGFSDTALMRKAFLRCLNTTPQRLRKAQW
ncbi:Putative amidase (plasmid) [Sodalis praecaptivus]|uniref:Putative amidase n=1 Tax=Sodalis praecaptivus TaxID=1239307 RepID=W0HZI5_9GAMM|nr:helix-turn-helix domain-containing protein [Sodalis praecaptivus]AHF79184.1 Putative amidase [Sodalis praecaptivus]